MIWLRRRRGIAGTMLILVAGLALAAATQTVFRGPAAGAATAAATPVQGIDVSSVNGAPTAADWVDVAGSDRFASIKASEGNYYTDPDYQSDVTGAIAAGLYVMPYVFANPYGSIQTNLNAGNGWGSVQADYAWTKMIGASTPAYKSSPLMLPVAVDLEPDPYVSTETDSNECYGLSPAAMGEWIASFITEMQKDSGKTPVIYTSTSWWSACTGNSISFENNPLWLASWGVLTPSIPKAWGSMTFWQYSDSGQFSGFGTADLDSLGPAQSSPVDTSIQTVYMHTLTSLVAQSVPGGYTAAGLPPGLGITTIGLITGRPTTVGQYSVTVTSPAGAVPASMTFPWDVHGAIAVAGATSRSSLEGTPASFSVTASGPDQSDGFAATFSATGLPAGVSMSSAGLITGSPTKSGTFTVAVTVADALGGSGTASFTWTVIQKDTISTSGQCLEMVGSGGAAKLELVPCSSGAGSQSMKP